MNNYFMPLVKINTECSAGTGFFINNSGYIITSNNIIKNSLKIFVKVFNNDQNYEAKIISICPDRDIILLKIDNYYSQSYLLGDSDEIDFGSHVALLAYPNIFQPAVIHNVDRYFNINYSFDKNFGGPMIELNSFRLVGIIKQSFNKFTFVIPIIELISIITELFQQNIVMEPKIYVDFDNNNLSSNGYLINKIYNLSPFHKAGIKKGDILLKINECRVDNRGFCLIPRNNSDLHKKVHIYNFFHRLNLNDNISIEYFSNFDNRKIKKKKIKLDCSELACKK